MTKKKKPVDPMAEIVEIVGRVVTQAQLTQFQLMTITRRLDALERTASPIAAFLQWRDEAQKAQRQRRRSGGARRKPGASASVTLPQRKARVTR